MVIGSFWMAYLSLVINSRYILLGSLASKGYGVTTSYIGVTAKGSFVNKYTGGDIHYEISNLVLCESAFITYYMDCTVISDLRR
ncbi:hypothetical protein SOASR032_10310 [Pragia fontium]|uniref:Uncharacterized protein n=1 Tax=Pragia fontium TaxID=82985 RepID=A0ABQ5LFT2_9GAMM|nr:hypothetical protein SOASR032_10310 [Pragia fontium]